MKYLKRIFLILTGLIFVISLATFGYAYSKLANIYTEDKIVENIKDSNNVNDINEVYSTDKADDITNILLIGTDGRSNETKERSDALILLTLDANNNDIKISSIARDTYVDIPGHSTEKLNHAYAYGGVNLLKEVFKINFNLDIDKYVIINFSSFMRIIDEVGGVVVDVEESAIKEINNRIDECYDYYTNKENLDKKEYIKKPGVQRLTGYQALSFSRVRYNDNAFGRDSRQRQVIESLYSEFLKSGISTYIKCVDLILDEVKTNIKPSEIIDLAYKALKIKDNNIEQFQFPLEEYRKGHIISEKKGWVLEWEKEPNLKAWHEFIFGKK